ncbi:glycosyltransferase [Micromonospora sp. NPDC049230]|uniref:glycosyltransferase n=1 Tax=Micromonospora sp. NPDC049230 TaxID=3155502 RepID=UPI0033DAD616
MDSRPDCSVIVPTYNRVALLARTLDALSRQEMDGRRFEVLVVDDGSTDNTAEVVDTFRERLDLRYFYQPDEGFRVAAARNVGIQHAAADVCVFLDSGVLAHSRCVRAHLDNHTGATSVAVIGYVYCFNHNNEDAEQMHASLDFDDVDGTIAALAEQGRWLDDREHFYRRYPGDAIADLPAPWLMYWTCDVSARTADLRAIGGFDEAFRSWGYEDVDLAYRLHRAGARFVVDRAASAIHFPHDKDHAHNKRAAATNLRYLLEKYDTPEIRVLSADPPVGYFDINDHLLERQTQASNAG